MLTPSAIPVSSSSVPSAIEVTVASLSNPAAELALIGTAVPQWAVCRTVAAATDAATWYRLDATSGATNVPYVVASLTAGLKWVAIAGAYANTLTVQDGTLTVVGSSDATKTLKFEVDAQSTGADLTIDTGAQTTDRTLTVPVLAGNRTLAVIDQAQTFTAVQTVSATAGLLLTAATGTSLTVSSSTDSTTKDTGSIVTEGGVGAEKSIYAGGKVVAQDATAGTAVNTGSIQTLGGYSAWKATFLRGTQLQGDSAAMLAEYYSNQTSDPAAQRNCLSFAHYNSGATAGNTSTTAGVNGLVQNSSAVTLSDVRCFQAAISTTHASAVNTASYGYYFSNSTNTGTTTTKTGFYCEALTGTTVYSFRSAGAGLVSIGDTTDSTSITTGSIVTAGGIGVAKRLTLDGATGKTLRIVNGVANAAVAVTFGAVGPTGSTAGNPQGWIRVDINGTDRYIPYW